MELKLNDRYLYKKQPVTIKQIKGNKACLVYDHRPNQREWESLANLMCEMEEGNLRKIKSHPWWKFWD